MSLSSPVRVFISYSHDSEDHAEKVLQLADRLRGDGVDAWIDQHEPAPAQGWPRWMEEQVERADFVLCVCTETYRRRFDRREEEGRGLGVNWEGSLLRSLLYLDQGENKKVFPLLFVAEDRAHIPLPLEATPRFKPLTEKGYVTLYRHLTDQPEITPQPLGHQKNLPPRLPTTAPPSTAPLAPYLDWAKDHYDHLDLIGIDAGDVQVRLDEVYVPLRMAHRGSMEAEGLGLGSRHRAELSCDEPTGQETIELENVLQRVDPPHVLMFGEPGAGKTTGLLKLHQMCWQPATLGLPADTVPVFLRLRHLSKPLLDAGLPAFLEHEIHQLTGKLKGYGEQLWRHGKLLLLLDGLDEIADAQHRAEVLRRIGWYLGEKEAAGMRAVVSCRRVGLPGAEADRDCLFQTFEVRPFQDEQIAQLVKLWFHEMARRDRISRAVADQRVATILRALENRQVANQQILAMVSNPLLLTLLCVVVLLGNEIPKRRVRFYEQCLDVLLDRWPKLRDKDSPVESADGRAAVARLAFFLHSKGRRDDLGWAEAVVELMVHFKERALADRFFDWLHGEVGLLVDYTEEEFGFVHLGIQEHLTARHLIAHPADLNFLDGAFDQSWWTEVFLQLSALSEQEGFHHLMSQLLRQTDALERRAGLLRDCLRETSRPELAAFTQVLEEDDGVRQEAVLRLLRGQEHFSPELLEVVERLAKDAESKVQKAAEHLLASRVEDRSNKDLLGLVYDLAEDEDLAKELAHLLKNWQGGRPVKVIHGTGRRSGQAMATCGALVMLVGPKPGSWKGAGPLRRIYEETPWLVVRLPGEPQAVVPEIFADCDVVDWRLGREEELMEAIVAYLPQEPAAAPSLPRKGAPSVIEQSMIEPVTGEVFLPVPGGTFLMGSDDLFTQEEQKRVHKDLLKAPTPAHQVRVSPFWLAQTPVTNRQYGLFFKATGHREPENWRDRRFSDLEQPVVGVSWEDAVAYCAWLTNGDEQGMIFQLPSEAQWEFAARGLESRIYPWGGESPSDTLACYNLNFQEDRPPAVGSYPPGAGPFGHLDLAGTVWEWCRDEWEADYSKRTGTPLDPIGEGDPDLRPLRGGCWWRPARSLRSATRSRGRPWLRFDVVGFRVLCAPSSLRS